MPEFLIPQKRDRYRELLGKARGRDKIRRELSHFGHFDPRLIRTIPPSEHGPAPIEKALRRLGAPDLCYVISESRSVDGREMQLTFALEAIVGYLDGSLISCLPGRLAFFEGENARFILQRDGPR